MSIDFKAVRVEYGAPPLLEAGVGPDPIAELACWLAEAAAAKIREPNAMTLATATPDGVPSARVVLLKGLDERGLIFCSHYDSRKARELAANPRAAAVFCWVELERQVRLEGKVERIDAAESDAHFATRPRTARLAAWASEQSRPIGSRAALEARYEEFFQRFLAHEVTRPESWGGYVLRPRSVELWQGRANRMHDRLLFERESAEPGAPWSLTRLQP